MGISWVLSYPTQENKTHTQALEDLGKLLTSLGFEKETLPFTVQCESYNSITLSPPRSFQVITDSDRPASCFLICDKNPNEINITTERSFMAFLGKLSNVYALKNSSVVEVRGNSFVVKDFIVRPGILTIAGTPKGIVLEAELRTCPVLINAVELMREFVNMFMPFPLQTYPSSFDTKQKVMENVYSTMDTVQQYYEIFNNVRRSQMLQQK